MGLCRWPGTGSLLVCGFVGVVPSGAQLTFCTSGIFTDVSIEESIFSKLQRLCLVESFPCSERSSASETAILSLPVKVPCNACLTTSGWGPCPTSHSRDALLITAAFSTLS